MAVELEIPCPKLPEIPELPSISVMGGAELKAFINFAEGAPTDCKVNFNLLLQLPPLLAVSACLLKVLEVMGKLLEFFQAAPDPFAMGDKALAVIPALEDLAGCIPALAPINFICMIKQILQLVVRFMSCFLEALESILNFQASIDLSVAEGNPLLETTLACAQDNAQVSMNNLMRSLEPLEPILASVSAVGGLVGLSLEIPDMSSLSVDAQADLGGDEIIASIQSVVDGLNQAIEIIPC